MKKNVKTKKRKNGFTLLEIIVVMGVIISVVTSIVALNTLSVSSTKVSRSQIIAISLSQEGLEIVRNIRDNNWLNGRRTAANWRTGIDPGDYRVQYNSSALLSFSATPLRLNSGFYQYDNGSFTSFYRKVTVEHIGTNQIKVVCTVTWQEQGRNHTVSAETRLYNWLEST